MDGHALQRVYPAPYLVLHQHALPGAYMCVHAYQAIFYRIQPFTLQFDWLIIAYVHVKEHGHCIDDISKQHSNCNGSISL